ncbi:hypothetical protein MACK_003723 [Theileria orientalis]|uniref:Uncharacterized protein n=1 Tax=Theileria orientalis TaxID=68886 RepID=A0A976SIS3_THEOR|nr:hypothetical protein MACK_003723 [Theileria orientalis]
MVLGCNSFIFRQIRRKVTVNSFKQWKDLLVFKRYDGKHVWSLPKFIPHEFGFRRIAKKPPFFKFRRFTFPKIDRNSDFGKDVLYNRDVFIKYGWEKKSHEFYKVKDYVDQYYKGVKVVGIPSGDNVLQVVDENDQ